MRLSRVRGSAQPVRRALLPDRDPVHRVRPRSRVPVSVGGQPRPDRLAGLDHHDGLPVRTRRGSRLRVEEGSARMGLKDTGPLDHALANPGATTAFGAANNPALHGLDQGYYNGLSTELDHKGFLVTSTEDLFQWARTGS